jgi:hypothetical protein
LRSSAQMISEVALIAIDASMISPMATVARCGA